MDKLTQKYCLVTFIGHVKEGFEYVPNEAPLHVTIVDVFATPLTAEQLLNQLVNLIKLYEPVMTIAQQDAQFGPDKQTLVTLLEMKPELIALHKGLVTSLRATGAVYNDPHYIEDGFVAHVTAIGGSKILAGDKVAIGELSLIDMFPDQNGYLRKVIKTIKIT